MIKVTIPQTIQGTIEIELPEYFKDNNSYYKIGDRVTCCLWNDNFPENSFLTTQSLEVALLGVNLDRITPISPKQFKEVMCRAFAHIAGFEIEEKPNLAELLHE